MTTLPSITVLLRQSYQRLRSSGLPALLVTTAYLLLILVLSPFVFVLSEDATYGVLVDAAFFLFALAVQVWLYGAIILMVERAQPAGAAIRNSWRKLWQLFLSSLGLFFVLALPLIILTIIALSFGVDTVDITSGHGILFTILTLLSYAWLLAASVYFLFVPFIILLEDSSPLLALRHSWERTRHHWAPLFWRYLLFIFVLTIGTALLNLIPGLGIYVAAVVAVPLSVIFFGMLYAPFRKTA